MTNKFTFLSRAAFLAALLLFAALFELGLRPVVAGAQMARETLVIITQSGRHSFDVEVARTDSEKARGLMFRTRLDRGHGMMFPYKKASVASMWMRNTYISLDMIFVTAQGRVHRVVARTEPHSEAIISSNGVVTGVLEIGAGEAARLQIKTGDIVLHSHFGSAEGEQ